MMEELLHHWIVLVLIMTASETGSQRYELWTPPYSNRTDLYCPTNTCPLGNPYFPFHSCCALFAIPRWKMSIFQRSIDNLQVKVTNEENSEISTTADQEGHHTFYQLHYVGGRLRKVPSNICNFKTTVEIDLSNNYIDNIDTISCMFELDSLYLSGNRITSLSVDTFKNCFKLRILDISKNLLNRIDPHTFDNTMLITAYLDYNEINTLDVSNFRLKWPFKFISFRKNKINSLTGFNVSSLASNPTSKSSNYGPGLVDLSGNDIGSDFRHVSWSLGLTKTVNDGMFFGFNHNYNEEAWLCDCRVVPYLHYTPDVYTSVERTFTNLPCYRQKHHRRSRKVKVQDIFTTFYCNYTIADGCPDGCKCSYKVTLPNSAFSGLEPPETATVIDCSGSSLDNLPDALPRVDNIEIDLSGSNIDVLSYRYYLANVTKMDMSNTRLETIERDALREILDIKSLTLRYTPILSKPFPREWSIVDPCQLQTEKKMVDCSGNSSWVRDWIEKKWCHRQEFLYCPHIENNSRVKGQTTSIWPVTVFSISGMIVILFFTQMRRRRLFRYKRM